jgi:hypothetical protein
MPWLAEWDSFYVIVGSAAGALVGLQFVVMTLMAQSPSVSSAEAGAAFGSPTIVHFSMPLFLAALLRAPWHGPGPVAIVLGLVGLGGMAYAILVAIRIVKQQRYSPVWEDWLFHLVLPIVAYTGISACAVALVAYPVDALFGVGAAVLLLLLIGIHNSWDAVAYHVFVNLPKRQAEAKSSPPGE